MWYVVNSLVIAAGLSAIVFLIGTIGFAMRERSRFGAFVASWTLLRRSAIFGVVTAALGTALHFGMVQSGGFVKQLPSALLGIDVRYERYGTTAIRELSERSVNRTLAENKALGITDALLATQWWYDAAQVQPFPLNDPVQIWFAIQIEKARIDEDQLATWLAIVEPIGVFRIESTTESWHVVGEWGRQWQRLANTPYRIDRVNVASIRVNGKDVEFESLEQQGSESRFGWEAPEVRFHYILPTDARTTGVSNSVEVEYALDLEPGAYRSVGPLIWRGTIVVN